MVLRSVLTRKVLKDYMGLLCDSYQECSSVAMQVGYFSHSCYFQTYAVAGML